MRRAFRVRACVACVMDVAVAWGIALVSELDPAWDTSVVSVIGFRVMQVIGAFRDDWA